MRRAHGDRYGRTVDRVPVDGRSLNKELVRAGLAWWFRRYAPNDRELARLELEARVARKNPIRQWLKAFEGLGDRMIRLRSYHG